MLRVQRLVAIAVAVPLIVGAVVSSLALTAHLDQARLRHVHVVDCSIVVNAAGKLRGVVRSTSMFLVSTGRAFLWDNLPLGFKIFNVASAAISIVYLILLFRAWRGSSKATSTPAALPEPGAVLASPTTDAERAEAAAATALAAAETAQAAATEANSAAERAVAAAAVDERAMAASSVGTFVTLGVAAAAVLLTGAGVLLAVEGGATPLPRSVFTQLVIATGWLVASLLFGAISASYVITHIGHKRSVATVRLVVVFAAAQFLALVVGALDFMLSIALF